MKFKEPMIIFKSISSSFRDEQKRMDEMCKILYELYCQHEKTRSFHVKINDNLTQEKSA